MGRGFLKGIFLQARLDSSRLPRKTLLKLCGKSVIEHAMESLNRVSADLRAVVTDKSSVSEFLPYTKKNNWEIFAGSKNNVLERYVKASKKFNAWILL